MAMGHGEISLDVRAVVDACQRTINAIDQHVRGALRRSAVTVANSAHRQHAYKDRTGSLSNSIRAGEPVGGTLVTVDVTADTPYAAAIELGAKPHVITARKGKALRFQVGGRTVFRRSVNHPGNKPYKFLAGALEREVDDIYVHIENALEGALEESGFEVI